MGDLNELITKVDELYSESAQDRLIRKEFFEERLDRLKAIIPDQTMFMLRDYGNEGQIVFYYAMVDYSFITRPILPGKKRFVVRTIDREEDYAQGISCFVRGMYLYSLDEVDSLMMPDGKIFFRGDSGLVESVYRLRWEQYEKENWPLIFGTSFRLTKSIFYLEDLKK